MKVHKPQMTNGRCQSTIGLLKPCSTIQEADGGDALMLLLITWASFCMGAIWRVWSGSLLHIEEKKWSINPPGKWFGAQVLNATSLQLPNAKVSLLGAAALATVSPPVTDVIVARIKVPSCDGNNRP